MTEALQLSELEALYSALTPDERDELLQCLLVAASRGGEAMLKTLEDYLSVSPARSSLTGFRKIVGCALKGMTRSERARRTGFSEWPLRRR